MKFHEVKRICDELLDQNVSTAKSTVVRNPQIRECLVDAVLTLATYRFIQEFGNDESGRLSAKTQQIVDGIGLPADDDTRARDDLRKSIEKWQGTAGVQIINMQRRKGQRTLHLVEPTEDQAFAVQRLEAWINSTRALIGVRQRPVIEVGVGTSLTQFHAWIAARRFQMTVANDNVNIRFHTGLPQQLRDSLDKGELDIVVTSFLYSDSGDTFPFPVRLLADRRQDIIPPDSEASFRDLLVGKTLLVQRERNPNLELPSHLIPQSCQILEVNSWAEAFASVLASHGVFCVATPDVLAARERTRFREIELPHLPCLNVGVRIKERPPGVTTPKQSHVESLAQEFRSQLETMVQDTNKAYSSFTRFNRSAHLALDRPGKRVWVHGELTSIICEKHGRFRGDHTIYKSEREDITLTFEGNITQDNGDPTTNYITLRGWHRDKGDPESYVAAFVVQDLASDNEIVGLWTGRAMLYDRRSVSSDLLVLYHADTQLGDEELDGIAKYWSDEHGEHLGPLANCDLRQESTENLKNPVR